MFGSKVAYKLKSDTNIISIDDLPKDMREQLLCRIEQHQYCPDCGGRRTISIIPRLSKHYDPRSGKREQLYSCKMRCSKHHIFGSTYTLTYDWLGDNYNWY
jgi:hypothetical protein